MVGRLLLVSILLQHCSLADTESIKCPHEDIGQSPSLRAKELSKFLMARDVEFVPYKVLFLIDETIPEPDYSKFKIAAEYVNERLSKFLKAKRLMDVRLSTYTEDKCSNCTRAKFPTEYMMPKCVSVRTPMKPNENASEEIIDRSKENYTLVVRVLSNKDGIGAGQFNKICTGLANAYECQFWRHLGGPTHGSFVYCKKFAEFQRGDIQLRTTTLHETLHIILPELAGFQEPTYRCRNLEACKRGRCNCATPYCHGCFVLGRGKTWKEVKRTMTNEQGEMETVTSFLAISEPVRDAARAHFNCPTAKGFELDHTLKEDGNVSFTGHWSMHLFSEEILAPIDAPLQKLSNLTMSALAAHPSWYKVDLSYAEELVISKPSAEMGCAVYEKTCHEFLDEQREKGGEDGRRIAPYCDMAEGGSEEVPSKCSNDHKIQQRCRKDRKTNCTHMSAEEGYYNSDVCNGATLVEKSTNRVPFMMGSPEGSICVTLTEVPGFASHPTYPLCVKHECDIESRVLILQFKPEQPNGLCYVHCTVDQSNKIVTKTRDPSCTNARSGRTSLACPNYETVCEKKTSTMSSTTITISTSTTAKVGGPVSSVSETDGGTHKHSTTARTTKSSGSAMPMIVVLHNLYGFALVILLLSADLEDAA